MRSSQVIGILAAAIVLQSTALAGAAPLLRKQISQHGDFVLIGNSGGFECAAGTPLPVVGTVTCPGQNVNDSSPDIFWRSQQPAVDAALANNTLTSLTARTTARLSLPANATVTYARLYWAGFLPVAIPADTQLTLERPLGTLNAVLTADASALAIRANAAFHWYQSSVDVTALVAGAGAGLYRVSGIASVELPGINNNDPINAWSMVVFYSLASDPPRNLALFDGLDLVLPGSSSVATLSGFLVPNAGFDAKLGVIAYEGEQQLTGDSLLFNGAVLSNALNPAGNFFNSSHSQLGNAVSVVGDLPQLSGAPGSMSGVDLDVVDVKAQLKANDSSATIEASSTSDTYLLGAFITSIATFQPDFTASNKTFRDLNGGSILPGDELEYVISALNDGNDASANTVVTDALPKGVTYEPGTLQITTGQNVGNKTDAKDSDQAEYDAMTRTVTVRVGMGATGALGGSIVLGGSSEIGFRVTVDANATGSILNQAIVTGAGQQGAPPSNFPTDGNGNAPGSPPTTAVVDQCQSNAECAAPSGVCNTAASPKVCVGCVEDSDCTDPTALQCNPDMHVCGCSKNCSDTDRDGIPDDVEVTIGTDPQDADSDDDGVPDGQEPNPGLDTDGDGLINALDPDSDDDGLFDGTELGLPCSNPATKFSAGHCRADADQGKTVTDPLDPDTDRGGVSDGSEDFNSNGAVEAGETQPSAGNGADDKGVKDSDKDGLSDGAEASLGSNPRDADTDDDGVRDGDEANPSDDTDHDGLNNVLDVDSDNDALFDGTESGHRCSDPATNAALGHCIADKDSGATLTSPLDPDTDHGGVNDGSEDFNRNGVVDAGETDPTAGQGADDASTVDTDGDGLSDGTEADLGSDPMDADSDDDGVLDGAEPNPGDDADGDGKINARDPDSDADGLFDGTELGRSCEGAATNATAMSCIADADAGKTQTNPLRPDTDFGSATDGDEDSNHNGRLDGGETDPNDPADDTLVPGGMGGSSAGGSNTGGGSGSTTSGASGGPSGGGSSNGGIAGDLAAAGSGASGGSSLGGANLNQGVLEGGGCSCRTAPGGSGAASGFGLGLLGLGLLGLRRKRS